MAAGLKATIDVTIDPEEGVSSWALGRLDEAIQQITLVMQEAPDFSPMEYAQTVIPLEHTSDAQHLSVGVDMAMTGRTPNSRV